MENIMLIGGVIRRLSNGLMREMSRYNESLGLTPMQGVFLHHIWVKQEVEHVPVYAKDLEQAFSIKHPTVSGILQRMEASGYLELLPDCQDRRCKAIRLTQKSLDTHAQTAEHIRQVETELTRGMSPTEIQELNRLLRIASDNLGCSSYEPLPGKQKEESQT